MRQHEHKLQTSCIKWYDMQFSQFKPLLFAIPNGGHRHKAVAGKMKAEGVRSGVADLLLLVPTEQHRGTFIEMKIDGGRQQDTQKLFQKSVEQVGYRYVVIKSFDDFRALVCDTFNKSVINTLK